MQLLFIVKKRRRKSWLLKDTIVMHGLTLKDLMSCLGVTGEIVDIAEFNLSNHYLYLFSAILFCNSDKLQYARRKMMRAHTFPTAGGDMWSKLDKVGLQIILLNSLFFVPRPANQRCPT